MSNFILYNQRADKKRLTKDFSMIIKEKIGNNILPTIICIGTDRSTGDSLGPWVGKLLKDKGYPGKVFGTIHNPVHAMNLQGLLGANNYFKDDLVIAIDASLGDTADIGKIYFRNGSLTPGMGINKEGLPKIGDFHIVGIVNAAGSMEYFVLQSTRLSLVVNMAEVIADAIISVFATENCKTM
jgi:putative sporulation protein YyaC